MTANAPVGALPSSPMTFTRRILPAGTALALVLTACGGSDSSDDETTDTVVITEAEAESTEVFSAEHRHRAETTAASVETHAGRDQRRGNRTCRDDARPRRPRPRRRRPRRRLLAVSTPCRAPRAKSGHRPKAVVASLVEWAIEAPTEYAAGEVTFTATNNGNFPHELVVIQGESYESLPLAEGGAVIEDDLPTGALLGRTARIGGGSSEDLTVTLAPGNYVLVCNLGSWRDQPRRAGDSASTSRSPDRSSPDLHTG